jgi:3-hydroxyanthranilate 3,4-dioxygenase
MVKGDMCLKIMEKGIPRDIPIKEGEMFVLPSRIPHSPQRAEDTLGLVIERERLLSEMDGLQ